MDFNFIRSTAILLLVNIIYSIVALFVGVLALKFIDHKLLKRIDLEEEIRKGNIAAAIFGSTILIFVAVIIGFALGR